MGLENIVVLCTAEKALQRAKVREIEKQIGIIDYMELYATIETDRLSCALTFEQERLRNYNNNFNTTRKTNPFKLLKSIFYL